MVSIGLVPCIRSLDVSDGSNPDIADFPTAAMLSLSHRRNTLRTTSAKAIGASIMTVNLATPI